MDTTEYFIYLLACHLNGNMPRGEKRLDWQQVYNLADKHNVTAIVAHEIKKLSEEYRPGGTIGAWFSENLEATRMDFIVKLNSLSEFISVLSKAKIEHLLYKGVVLRNLYPVPGLRVGSDADVIVKPVDFISAIEALGQAGFVEKNVKSNIAEMQIAKDNFEIHTEFESINIQSKIYFATPFDDVSDSIDYTYKLKPAYHLLYVIIHIAHHLKTGGVGIRMIMDIDVLIRKYPEININELLRLCENVKIGKTAEVLIALSKKLFNTPVSIHFTFEDEDTQPLLRELTSTVISGNILGNSGTEAEAADNKGNFFKKLFGKIASSKNTAEETDNYVAQLLEELEIKEKDTLIS